MPTMQVCLQALGLIEVQAPLLVVPSKGMSTKSCAGRHWLLGRHHAVRCLHRHLRHLLHCASSARKLPVCHRNSVRDGVAAAICGLDCSSLVSFRVGVRTQGPVRHVMHRYIAEVVFVHNVVGASIGVQVIIFILLERVPQH